MISFSLSTNLHAASGPIPFELSGTIPDGSLTAVYGASGAGKTTLLRMLAGLLTPAIGSIITGGETWLDTARRIALPPGRRRIGMVFQDYALFPNMTVGEHLVYALPKGAHRNDINVLSEAFELQPILTHYPHQLSGGQKQRVALARALVRKPRLLLLDEPLSALDPGLRTRLQDYILHAHRQYGLTTLMVSHDLPEIFKMADNVVVLQHGRITRQGLPNDVFGDAVLSSKFQFIGQVMRIDKEDIIYVITLLIHNDILRVTATAEDVRDLAPGDKVQVAAKAFNPIIRRIDPKAG